MYKRYGENKLANLLISVYTKLNKLSLMVAYLLSNLKLKEGIL
ncbi:hypothetical protein [Clostridium sp. CF012]|nr:hypothetical protein [Clostridium sp. CF012]